MPTTANAPNAVDFYFLDELLTDEELATRDRLRDFCAREVTPHASRWWEAAEFPFELIPKMAKLSLAGGMIKGYGCPGLSSVAVGLIAREWARADGSVGTFFGRALVSGHADDRPAGVRGTEAALATGDGAHPEGRGVRAD